MPNQDRTFKFMTENTDTQKRKKKTKQKGKQMNPVINFVKSKA